ncbi:transposase for insertion sequence element IS1328 [Yersinia enterocolitica]|nr:transposase for insertion sequence element IS1328 [Yersinia enterocolitica]
MTYRQAQDRYGIQGRSAAVRTLWLTRVADFGHEPKLIYPQFVRPFVKSNKNDFVDAEAICEAASRPSMRFVKPRTQDQQAMAALHRVRDALIM